MFLATTNHHQKNTCKEDNLAKRNRQVKKKGHDFHATEEVNDYILPSAQELVEYKAVDSSLIDFLKERAIIEQDERHSFNRDIVKINKREQKLHHGLNYAALFCGFAIIMAAMFLSYTLISLGNVLSGSVFGGIGVLYVAYLFISVINRSAKPPSE